MLITEAECVALSQSLRYLIPVHNICDALCEVNFANKDNRTTNSYSVVYDDSKGALELYRETKFIPGTKT